MPRQPKLRRIKKQGREYWGTQAGGSVKYFGRTSEVPHKEAEPLFRAYLAELRLRPANDQEPEDTSNISSLELVNEYLTWVQQNLSANNYSTKKSFLARWCRHRVFGRRLAGHGRPIGHLVAMTVTAQHLSEFVGALSDDVATKGKNAGQPLSETALSHAMVHVKACWSWASDPQRGALFPADHRPFAGMKKVQISPKPKAEVELATQEEIELLFTNAEAGRRNKSEPRVFEDVLRFTYGTGCRPGELAALQVRDVQLRTRQVTLGRHKRTHAQSAATIRDIQLDDETLEICRRLCRGRDGDSRVFVQPNGAPWNQDRLDERFRRVRRLAGVRESITLYSYRHLWITDLIESPQIPIATIAAMAGTSIKMIEQTYGHFRNQAKAEAIQWLAEKRRLRAKD